MAGSNVYEEARASGFTVRDYIRILWARKWLVALVAFLVVAVVEALSFMQTPVYRAEVRLVLPPPAPIVSTGGLVKQPEYNNTDTATQSQFIESPTMASLVISASDQLEGIDSVALSRRVDASPVPDTPSIITIRVEDREPERVALLANGYATAYLDYRGDKDTEQLNELIGELDLRLKQIQTRLDQLRGDLSAKAKIERTNLTEERLNKEGRKSEFESLVKRVRLDPEDSVLSPAQVPAKPVKPDKVRNGVIALIVGLILGAAAAFLREYLRDSIPSADDVEREAAAPVLGAIPYVPEHSTNGSVHREEHGAITEAFRTLRTNLGFLTTQRGVRQLLITSPGIGDGKTMTAANLAVALTQAGRRVVLVDADLRRPSIHKRFGIEASVGLSNVLAREIPIVQAIVDPGIPRLRILPAGPVPANPTELLDSPAMLEVVRLCSAAADYLIVDSPPVGLADASVLASRLDGVVLVVDQDASRRELLHATQQLGRVDARLLGIVINKAEADRGAYLAYGDYRGAPAASPNGKGRRDAPVPALVGASVMQVPDAAAEAPALSSKERRRQEKAAAKAEKAARKEQKKGRKAGFEGPESGFEGDLNLDLSFNGGNGGPLAPSPLSSVPKEAPSGRD